MTIIIDEKNATTSDMIATEAELLDFFEQRGGIPGSTTEEKLDTPFLEAGIISSVGLVELVMHIEQRFGLELDPDELQGPDFQTCRGIARIIRRRQTS